MWLLPEWCVSSSARRTLFRRPPRALAAASSWTRPRCTHRVRGRSGRRPHRQGSRSSVPRFHPMALVRSGSTQATSGQYGGDFYWNGGSSQITPSETSVWLGPLATNYFGFLLVCGKPACSQLAGLGEILVSEIVLGVHETVGPSMSASGLWQASGWVRGTWPLGFSGDSPSGLCAMYATLGGQSLPGSSSSQSPWTWHQCDAPAAERLGCDRGLRPGREDAGAERLGRGRQHCRLQQDRLYRQPAADDLAVGPEPGTGNRRHSVRDRDRGRGAVGCRTGSRARSTAAAAQWYPGATPRCRSAASARTRCAATPRTTRSRVMGVMASPAQPRSRCRSACRP